MYKTKLQELCQRRNWELPSYTTVKDGPDHMPSFKAYIHVHGDVFETPAQCKSAKDAQNNVAKIALDHYYGPPPPPRVVLRRPSPAPAAPTGEAFVPATVPPVAAAADPLPTTSSMDLPDSPLPSSLPIPRPGLLSPIKESNTKSATGDVLPQNSEDNVYRIAIGTHDESYKDTLHMFKNRLQQYAQKQCLGFPVYSCETEGPPHSRRFKSRVSLGGKSYETLEFFPTLKVAEQAAAKVACQVLSVDVIQEDGGLYKNLLQEFAQKKSLLCPSYETVTSGMSHRPSFVSTVEIGSDTFRGAEAKTKKQAEMDAAKVAYFALTERFSVTGSSGVSSVKECAVADNLTQNIQPTPTIKNASDTGINYTPVVAQHEKRAKSSPDKTNANSPSDDGHLLSSQAENSTTSAETIVKQPAENQGPVRKRNVVIPRSYKKIPEGATVKPYSDDQWISYQIELPQEPTA